MLDSNLNINEKAKDIAELEKSVRAYIGSKRYDYAECTKLRQTDVVSVINEISSYLILFLKSYDTVFEYLCDTDEDESLMLEDMLIEFNNAMSHVLMASLNQNKESNAARAKTHLYRGTLDGYKQVIVEHGSKISKTHNLRQEYKDIRLKETGFIGTGTDSKVEIAKLYEKFIEKILKTG